MLSLTHREDSAVEIELDGKKLIIVARRYTGTALKLGFIGPLDFKIRRLEDEEAKAIHAKHHYRGKKVPQC
jgi:hypothetical protein